MQDIAAHGCSLYRKALFPSAVDWLRRRGAQASQTSEARALAKPRTRTQFESNVSHVVSQKTYLLGPRPFLHFLRCQSGRSLVLLVRLTSSHLAGGHIHKYGLDLSRSLSLSPRLHQVWPFVCLVFSVTPYNNTHTHVSLTHTLQSLLILYFFTSHCS